MFWSRWYYCRKIRPSVRPIHNQQNGRSNGFRAKQAVYYPYEMSPGAFIHSFIAFCVFAFRRLLPFCVSAETEKRTKRTMPIVNVSACFQSVTPLSILNLSPSVVVLSEDVLCRKAASEAEHCRDPVQRVRLQCLAAGQATGKKLVRHFLALGQPLLEPAEFARALAAFAPLALSDTEAQRVAEALADQSEQIAVEEALQKLMPPMKAHRQALVQEVFSKMDPKGTDSVPLSALSALFEHRRNAQFESGAKSRDELWSAFCAAFQPAPDGRVLRAEFLAFFAAQSAAVHSDIHFDWMIRSQWKI